jgi:two-component system chemotaxis response regulator CheB
VSGARAPRRVLFCEDSRGYAAAFSKFLERDEDIEVVGIAASGEQAITDVARLRPDLLTLDMQLPGIDGLEVVRRLMGSEPLPIVILSATVARGSERSAEALAAGALEVLAKDMLRLDHPDDLWARAMRSRLRRLSSMRVSPRPVKPPVRMTAPDPKAPHLHLARAIGIGASTGGPPVLQTILADLPSDFPIPVLVVQHMTPGFIDGFARWLNQNVSLPVGVAADSQRAQPGVWLAPDGTHLRLTKAMRFALSREPEAAHRPSVDELLASLPDAVGGEAVAVVLTGMGRDGAAGAMAVRAAGGTVIAQDEASSVVYGMPQAVAQGGADLVGSPAEIAATIAAIRPSPRRD